MNIGIVAAIAYGLLAVVGGVLGYTQGNSKISLISGGICGALLITGGVMQWQGIPWGLILATAVSILLVIVFIIRLIKTRKLMPAVLMIIAGLAAAVAMIYQLQFSISA
ncbi:TMEM14 family protein [Limnoraphis robusta Tam1]|uniref:Small integral membrane protein n=1 Tax=Limnoraphis robusta CS-951 TaxID=1637645 RepID=A0A0F5YLZ9_9CYAN|nr:TMEM14 family protein [Limnoraphis robusta]KKD39916.1 small integral membrane protein [Limnoraphis robusta CS-951]MEA5496881.1 TMEM14 family protein [Limnoraphis robusta BA-68 BA1]MEA5541271.1 TMEM14 family protein [Limnoraphis robusta Tam1]